MLKVDIDRIVTVTEARSRLSALVEEASDDEFWVLTKGGKPRVALVDVAYLDGLIRAAQPHEQAEADAPAHDRSLLREALAGYAAAARTIDDERVARLRQMSREESWAVFVQLGDGGTRLAGDPATLAVFEPRRIADTLVVRRALDRLARVQNPQQ